MAESFKHDITEADFKLFLVLWNQSQNMRTPAIHFAMAQWLERAWKSGDTELLLMAFRSSGKSTICGLFAAWLLYRHSDLRILVLAADEVLAGKMVRNVKRIIERHPLTAHMKPERADQWASDRFTIKRNMELRDPSMLAKGITSNITGSRADIVICDDVEVPGTCDSAEKRQFLRERLAELSFVVVPGGTHLYIGTPHHFYTIYAERPRSEIGEERSFLQDYKRLCIPLLDGQGQSAWPERFNAAEIERVKRNTGPNKFTSQMMLKPVNVKEGRLNPDLLKIYTEDLDYTKELATLFIGPNKIVGASAWWDPAFGSAQGDHSVLACCYADADGNLYLHHVEYIKLPDALQGDEASAQCRIVAELAKRLYLPSITVEINGIGKFLPAILRNELALMRVPATVVEYSNRRAKDVRILEAFDAPLAAGRLCAHQSLAHSPFLMEMREWRPGSNRGHDDGLDAAAGAISQQPVRLKRHYGKGSFGWMRGKDTHKAKTDFEV